MSPSLRPARATELACYDRRRRVWGSNAPRRKSVSPAGSTRTKRNLLQVTPAVLLQPAGGTRSTLTSCGPHPPYTFTSCGSHPPYCCFVPAVPAALSCLAATDTRSKYTIGGLYRKSLYLARYLARYLVRQFARYLALSRTLAGTWQGAGRGI